MKSWLIVKRTNLAIEFETKKGEEITEVKPTPPPEEIKSEDEKFGEFFDESIDFRRLKKTIIERLYPTLTNIANEGTFALVDQHPVMEFADAGTKEAVFQFIYPRDLKILTMEFIWETSAASGNLYWKASFGAMQKGEQSSVRTTGGTLVATPTIGGDLLNYTRMDGVGGIELRKLKPDDLIGIRLERQGGHASDTLNDGVGIFGIKITYI